MRRKISPKFHVKNSVKNGKFHANFTLLGRSADRKSSLAGCESGPAGQGCDGLAVTCVGKHSAMDCHAALSRRQARGAHISVQACLLACE